MKIDYQLSENEALHIVREELRQRITSDDVLGNVVIEKPFVSCSMTEARNANQNKIWLIKLIRQVACDVDSGKLVIQESPNKPNTFGLGDAKDWVENYIRKNCS